MRTFQQDKGVQESEKASSDSSSPSMQHLHGGYISYKTALDYSTDEVGDMWPESEYQDLRIAPGGLQILGRGVVTHPFTGSSEIVQVSGSGAATLVADVRQGIMMADNWNAIQTQWGGSTTTRAPNQIAFLLALLRRHDKVRVAELIEHYSHLRDQEPNRPPITIESLRSLVRFMIQEPDLLPPIIGSDPQGCMEIEWHLRDNGDPNSVWGRGNGVVSLKFLEAGDIQFVALSGPFRRGQGRLKIHGTSARSEIMADLGEFAQRVTTS